MEDILIDGLENRGRAHIHFWPVCPASRFSEDKYNRDTRPPTVVCRVAELIREGYSISVSGNGGYLARPHHHPILERFVIPPPSSDSLLCLYAVLTPRKSAL